MSRIVLFADSRWRDSYGLTFLKQELLDLGHEPYIAPFDLWQQAVELIRPSGVVLNHAFGTRNKEIIKATRRHNGKVFILPTEGRPNNNNDLDWFSNYQGGFDLLLAWNDILAKRLSPSVVTGCPRFDIYQKPELILSRTEAAEKHGLDPGKPIVLVASSFPQAKFWLRNRAFNKRDWQDLQIMNNPQKRSPEEFAKREYDGLQKFQLAVAQLSIQSGYQIAVKPHPMESYVEWTRFCDQHGVALITQEYIFNLINMADIFINRVGCITTQDAWLLGRTALQCNFDNRELSGAEEEAWRIGSAVTTIAALCTDVEGALTYGSVPPKEATDAYLDKYGFSVRDASKKCAKAIDNILPDSTYLPFNKLGEWNKIVNNFDQAKMYPDLQDMHLGKTVTQNTINNHLWEIRNG